MTDLLAQLRRQMRAGIEEFLQDIIDHPDNNTQQHATNAELLCTTASLLPIACSSC